jgi:hypothetical protein
MKQLIMLVIAMLCTVSVYAGATSNITSIDVSKLSPEQRAALLQAATQMENQPGANNPGFSESMRKEVEKWGELGTGMGRAAVNAAKEVGLAANDFVQTPLGKVTMGVVLYKVMGRDILRFAICMLLITIFMPLAVFFTCIKKHGEVTYDTVPVLKGLWHRKIVKNYDISEGQIIFDYVAGFVCGVIVVASAINSF